ncbi:MAG: tRNA pseudouridine(38-40) synthase TruA [Bacteroidota bacterium]|nr:tRNA pseudouridine(38-40) synthase TruA [Bacteroidota bacterium]
MRFFLEIAYRGTAYHGWQIQKNAVTVQEVLNKILSKLLSHEVATIGSGRTDTGVHALQQFVHIDSTMDLMDEGFMYRMNKMLPREITLKSVKKVKEDAHARFDAISRSYEYRIITEKNPFLIDLRYYYSKSLDLDTMNEASKFLLEQNDFESFSKVKTDVRTFNCKIARAEWIRNHEGITFYISADRFLRGMVRAIVGTLLEVGQNKLTVKDFEEIIKSKNRRSAGKAAPAHGLFFSNISFPEHIFYID